MGPVEGVGVFVGVFVGPGVLVGVGVGPPTLLVSTRSATMAKPDELAFLVPVTRTLTVWLPLVKVGLVQTNTWSARVAAYKSTFVTAPPSMDTAKMPWLLALAE